MSLLEKVSGLFYPLITAVLLIGFTWSGLRWIAQRAAQVDTWIPDAMVLASGLLALVLAAWMTEKLIPLRALAQVRWIYRERPRRRMRGLDRESFIQVGVFAGAGLILGLATGVPVVGALIAVVARVAAGMRGTRRLSSLLRAGRTRVIGLSPWSIQDSELVADALAATWLRWRPAAPTENLLRLFLRRLRRRSYLLVTAVVIIAAAFTLADGLGTVAVAGFLLAWSILGAGFHRCADFSRLGRSSRLPTGVLLVHALVAVVMMWGIWGMAHPVVTVPLVVAAVVSTGWLRGRPRRVDHLTAMDNGFGVTVPPELVGYYLSGLSLSSVVAVVLVFLGP